MLTVKVFLVMDCKYPTLFRFLLKVVFVCSLAEPTESSPDRNQCLQSEFSCSDGTCIEVSLRCDGRYDCQGGEDEQDCCTSSICLLHLIGYRPNHLTMFLSNDTTKNLHLNLLHFSTITVSYKVLVSVPIIILYRNLI